MDEEKILDIAFEYQYHCITREDLNKNKTILFTVDNLVCFAKKIIKLNAPNGSYAYRSGMGMGTGGVSPTRCPEADIYENGKE